MWTINYKGVYVHGYCNRDECHYNCIDGTKMVCKSLHAAKCRITRSVAS